METKTVEQTSGRVGQTPLPTSQEVTSGGNVVSKSLQAGDKLATDMLKILGQGAQVRQQHNTLSVSAAKRVAEDNLARMSIDLLEVQKNAKPNDDRALLEAENKKIYLKYGNQTFENEDAQRTFDDIYHKKGALATAKLNTQLTLDQREWDAAKTLENNTNNAAANRAAGVETSADEFNDIITEGEASGYNTREQSETTLVDGQINSQQNLDVDPKQTSKDFELRDEKTGAINEANLARFVYERYGGLVELIEMTDTETGVRTIGIQSEVTSDGENVLTEKSVNRIRLALNPYLPSYTKDKTTIKNTPWLVGKMKEVNELASSLASLSLSPEEAGPVADRVTVVVESIMNSGNSNGLGEEEATKMILMKDKVVKAAEAQKILNARLFNPKTRLPSNEVTNYVITDMPFTYDSLATGESAAGIITPEQMSNAVTVHLNTVDTSVSNLDVGNVSYKNGAYKITNSSGKDITTAFDTLVTKTYNEGVRFSSEKRGKLTPVLSSAVNKVNGDSSTTFGSLEELRTDFLITKKLKHAGYQAVGNVFNMVEKKLENLFIGKDLSKMSDEAKAKLNKQGIRIIGGAKDTLARKSSSPLYKSQVDDALESALTSGLNAVISAGAHKYITQDAAKYTDGTPDALEKYMHSNIVDIKSFGSRLLKKAPFTSNPQRVIGIKATGSDTVVGSEVTVSALANLLDGYSIIMKGKAAYRNMGNVSIDNTPVKIDGERTYVLSISVSDANGRKQELIPYITGDDLLKLNNFKINAKGETLNKEARKFIEELLWKK